MEGKAHVSIDLIVLIHSQKLMYYHLHYKVRVAYYTCSSMHESIIRFSKEFAKRGISVILKFSSYKSRWITI